MTKINNNKITILKYLFIPTYTLWTHLFWSALKMSWYYCLKLSIANTSVIDSIVMGNKSMSPDNNKALGQTMYTIGIYMLQLVFILYWLF